jgi:PEP-CTERM motif
MNNTMKPTTKTLATTCALAIGLLVAANPGRSYAAAELTLYDGVNPLITVSDNGPGDFNPITGAVLVVTNVGVWNLAISSGLTKPVTGSSTDPVMDVNIQANSTAAGSLRLVFSDNGFGPAAGTLMATITGHLTAGAPATASYDVYGDPANVVGATTVHIAGTGTLTFPIGPTTASGALSLGAPFSLTQVEQIVASGPSFVNSDASFQVVPEPSTIGLAAFGLATLTLMGLRRRNG